MATYQDLMSQKAALERQAAHLMEQIETARQAEHADAVARIKALMSEYGITLADLGSGKAAARPVKSGAPAKTGKRGAPSGRKIAAKYRDSATGDTWSGRGLQPNWLKARLASGHKIDEFAV